MVPEEVAYVGPLNFRQLFSIAEKQIQISGDVLQKYYVR